MGTRRIVVAVVLVAAGCSGGSKHSSAQRNPLRNPPPTQLNANWVCRRYLTGHLVSSDVTTVGDFRTTTLGTSEPAQLHRFPKLSPDTAAAWCWTGKPGAYNVYEVASDGEVQQLVGNMGGVAPANAHGAPSALMFP